MTFENEEQYIEEQSIDFAEYLNIIRKHKVLIILFAVLVILITMYTTYKMTPVYRATAKMVIDIPRSSSPFDRSSYVNYYNQKMMFKTHTFLITSRPVVERVIQVLELDKVNLGKGDKRSAPIEQSIVSQYRKNINLLFKKEQRKLTEEEKNLNFINGIRSKIAVKEVEETRLLEISASDVSPEKARDIANAVAKEYIGFNISNRLGNAKNTLERLTSQLYETQKKLEDAEAEFLRYKEEEKIFSVKDRQNLIAQKIIEFNDEFLQARNKRLELDAKLEELSRMGKKKLRSLIDNTVIESLYSSLVEAEVEQSRLKKVYRGKHPKLIQIETKIRKVRAKLNREISKEIENMKSQRSVLQVREEVLQKTIMDFEAEALELNKKSLKYTIYERNVETNQNLYNTLLSKLKETDIGNNNIDVSNIRVVEEAITPSAPSWPNKRRRIMMGIFIGLIGGIGLAFLREYMDQTIRTEEDVMKHLKVPVLSVIPKADSKES